MDDSLHCNWLKCRKTLVPEGKAVVTTCSPTAGMNADIFCVSCAQDLFNVDKRCPACKTVLDQPDDVVLSSLSPTADYRSSVLAGLAPEIVMDITTRSLAFWQYQQNQEAAYQSMLLKTAQERAGMLEKRLQTIVSEANHEITFWQKKATTIEQEAANDKRKARELQEALRAATKDYERLKSRMEQEQRRTGAALSAPVGPPERQSIKGVERNGPPPGTPRPSATRGPGSGASLWDVQARGGVMPPSPSRSHEAFPALSGSRYGETGGNHDRFNPGGSSPPGARQRQDYTSSKRTEGSVFGQRVGTPRTIDTEADAGLAGAAATPRPLDDYRFGQGRASSGTASDSFQTGQRDVPPHARGPQSSARMPTPAQIDQRGSRFRVSSGSGLS